MLNNKIIGIRKYLDLTQTQASNLLNLSSYKYRWYEERNVEFPIELVLILSLIYGVPIDYFISDQYSIADTLSFDSIQELKELDNSQKLQAMKSNIVKHIPYKKKTISYRSINNIINKYKQRFAENLEKFRTEKGLEYDSMAKEFNVSEDEYMLMESKNFLPDKSTLLTIAEVLKVDVQTLFN